MKFKMLLGIVLAMTMSFGTVAVYADEAVSETVAVTTTEVAKIQDPTLTYGTVVEKSDKSILAKDVKDVETIYNIDEKTIFIDSGTGEKVAFDSIKEGDGIYFYHSPIMAMSYPGQTYVYAVAVNTPMDAGCIKYHVVNSIIDNGDTLSITTDESDLTLKTGKDVEVSFFGTDKKGSIEDIKPGVRFFTWYQSGYDMNGQPVENPGVLNKIVIAPYTDGEISVYANYNEVAKKGIIKDGTAFVPLRAVADSFGMSITWDGSTNTCTVDDKTRKMSFTVGNDSYISYSSVEGMIGMTAPLKLGAAPYIDDEGNMYVPAEAFSVMVGYNVKVEGNGYSVSIVKE
ncbi:MAG TPA: copper amine oxidase N-terminal domain-containing protein [Candidatus Fimicola cottocaccae]|nr:copper amine oxidase N-terminal domain-containing protein [Candidatus Fimicola cottocaccae]